MKMKRDCLEPDRYEYLDREQSQLYDKAKALKLTQKQACNEVAKLIREIARMSRTDEEAYER
jgi:hypothetical protein